MEVLNLDRKEIDIIQLFSEDQIQSKVKELAEQINRDFDPNETLYLICVLKGSSFFAIDLSRHLTVPVQMEFVRLSSYGNGQESSGTVKSVDLTLPSLSGKNVLIVEDIIDTGNTAQFMLSYLQSQHQTKKVEFVALLDKTCKREVDVKITYAGFNIDDKFVVGYGLDYLGYYRNLNYIGYFPQ